MSHALTFDKRSVSQKQTKSANFRRWFVKCMSQPVIYCSKWLSVGRCLFRLLPQSQQGLLLLAAATPPVQHYLLSPQHTTGTPPPTASFASQQMKRKRAYHILLGAIPFNFISLITKNMVLLVCLCHIELLAELTHILVP